MLSTAYTALLRCDTTPFIRLLCFCSAPITSFLFLHLFQYMLLSLLYRSTSQESHCGVSYFSLVVVGLQPRLLVDCTEVTRSNVTKSLTSLAAHMGMLPSLLDSQQSSRAINDLDFFIATCLSIAQARPFKPGIIMITECNISSSCSQVPALMFLTERVFFEYLTAPFSPFVLQP